MSKSTIDSFVPQEYVRTVWTKQVADLATSFVVYIFWKLEDGERQALYVGRSYLGISRPLHCRHDQAREGRAQADEIEFIYCPNALDCAALERRLIRRLQPPLNKTGTHKFHHPQDPPITTTVTDAPAARSYGKHTTWGIRAKALERERSSAGG